MIHTYTTRRDGAAWVVVRDDQHIQSRHPAGAQGAEAAAEAARDANRKAEAAALRTARAANSVRKWRLKHGLTQAQLAQRLGVKVFTLQRWEYGSSDPPLYLALALEQLDHILQ